MRDLPYDYARCNPVSQGCDRKFECARFTSPKNPNGWQVCHDFSAVKVGECTEFHSNKEGG